MFYANPAPQNARILICYRRMRDNHPGISHVGLGVNAMHTARVLRAQRIVCDVAPTYQHPDIAAALLARQATTHCLIEAPWVSVDNMHRLLAEFPSVHFVCRCHSQVGFLQVEAGAVKLIRDYLPLQDGQLTFSMAGNSRRFCDFIQAAYNARCLYLPNLYDVDRAAPKQFVTAAHLDTLRLGSFGAIRLLKNHITAGAAALLTARRLGKRLEFHLSVNREEHGKGVLQAIRNLFAGLDWAKLVECPWSEWGNFRNLIASMHCCLQLSATETFNLVTADAAAELVPSVVSDAIEWAPASWQAEIDNAEDAARVACGLLHDPQAAIEGARALRGYVQAGIGQWTKWLGG